MAKFDFVESAASGYRYVWRERHAILPLTVIPLAVKMGSYAAIALLGLEGNYLRQGLVMMPAFLLEGFVVALVIRMALFDERYGNLFELGSAPAPLPLSQRQPIMAGVVVYLMTKLVSSFLSSWMMIAEEVEKVPGMPEPNGSATVTAIMILVFMVWLFRFFWLYVPAAMGISISQFVHVIRGFNTSIYMIGLWVLCLVPVSLVWILVMKSFTIILPGGQDSPVYLVIMSVVNSICELGIAITAGVAMGYAVRSVMGGPGRKPKGFF